MLLARILHPHVFTLAIILAGYGGYAGWPWLHVAIIGAWAAVLDLFAKCVMANQRGAFWRILGTSLLFAIPIQIGLLLTLWFGVKWIFR